MILYRPTDGDVHTSNIPYHPRTCFLMTQLGHPLPEGLTSIRTRVATLLRGRKIKLIDANSIVTGKDFLDKIWRLIVGVPLGIAIIHEDMSPKTLSNIFYELGMMDALGKQTLVIKSKEAAIPSDFVRTEYIEFDRGFRRQFNSFLNTFLELAEYFETMAESLEKDPLLSIDYLRRAYLISGDVRYRRQAKAVLKSAQLQGRARNSVEMLLARF